MQRLREIESVTAKRRELHEMKNKKGKSKKKANFEQNLNKAEKFRLMVPTKLPPSSSFRTTTLSHSRNSSLV